MNTQMQTEPVSTAQLNHEGISTPREKLTLSVIVPCYNEESTLHRLVQAVNALPVEMEIICVDDCSSDRTCEVMNDLLSKGLIQHAVSHPFNRGKGAAIRTGLSYITGHVVVVQDADLEYDPREILELLEPILMGRADAVYGSRFRTSRPGRVLFFWHRLGNGLLTVLSNMLTNLNLTDMETCYKVIRADLIKQFPLKSNRFGFEPEVTSLLAKSGARIYEVGISYFGRTYDEGKKISWKDGLAAFWHLLRYNLRPNPVRGLAQSLGPFEEFVKGS